MDTIVRKILLIRNFPNLQEILFFTGFVIYVSIQLSLGTMYYLVYPDGMIGKIYLLVVLLLVIKILLFNNWDLKDFLVYGLLTLLIYNSCHISNEMPLFYYYMFILAAKNIRLENIVKLFLAILIVGIVFTVFSAKIGWIMGLTNTRSDSSVIRYSLGMIYPTDFAARAFYLQLSYIIVRKFKLTLPEYITGFAFSVMMYIITDTRLDFILMIVTLLLTLGYRYIINIIEYIGEKWLMFIGALGIFGMIILTYIYSSKYSILQMLDKVLSTRLKNGHVAFEDYNVTLFGQNIPQHGNGGLQNGPFHYFFIDCTFIRILMMNGLIVFVAVLVLLCYLIRKSINNKAYGLVIALILVVVSSLIDHHMPDLSFNIIFLACFANIQYFSDDYKFNTLGITK